MIALVLIVVFALIFVMLFTGLVAINVMLDNNYKSYYYLFETENEMYLTQAVITEFKLAGKLYSEDKDWTFHDHTNGVSIYKAGEYFDLGSQYQIAQISTAVHLLKYLYNLTILTDAFGVRENDNGRYLMIKFNEVLGGVPIDLSVKCPDGTIEELVSSGYESPNMRIEETATLNQVFPIYFLSSGYDSILYTSLKGKVTHKTINDARFKQIYPVCKVVDNINMVFHSFLVRFYKNNVSKDVRWVSWVAKVED